MKEAMSSEIIETIHDEIASASRRIGVRSGDASIIAMSVEERLRRDFGSCTPYIPVLDRSAEKAKIIEEVQKEYCSGMKITDIAKKHSLHRNTVSKFVQAC